MKFLITWASLLLPLFAAADTVVPADKVTTQVNIRQAPAGGADVIGHLQQGESLPFLATADGWNEVRLDSGESGFISADWSRVVPAADAAVEAGQDPAPIAAVAPRSESEPEQEPEPESEPEPDPEPDPEPEPEPEAGGPETALLPDAAPEPEPGAVIDADVPAETTGPAGPPGPPGPPGPAGVDGEGSIKGEPDYLVKFKSETSGRSSQIFDNGNQVGIGTDEPAQRLDVNGSIQIHDRNSNLAGLMITQADGETGYIMHNRASTLTIGAGSVDRITIDRDGNVGIGTARPTHPVHLPSGAHVTAGGVWTNSSSRARKQNIRALSVEDALATVEALEPVHFSYRDDAAEQHVGFIAEDVPEMVASSDRKGLSTMDIVAVLTRVIQAQQQQIKDLESRLDAVE